MADFPHNLDRHHYDPHPCPRCGTPSITDRWCARCGKSWTGHDEMAAAMDRPSDPSTDEGYGPRARND